MGLVTLFIGCNGLARMEYFCSECATDRHALQLCAPMNRPLVTLYSLETPTVFTAIKRTVEPGPCRHCWVFASGKGGWFINGVGAESRRNHLVAMENLGMVESASRVDPAAALELIRWTLRTDIPEEVFRERCVGADSRPMEFDSDASFRRWLEEFPLKPARDR